mmetsp:Transcript_118296/g.334294  ORF Transcript_118296/g.334294 Transcript_118296/m.334294 type:complete len:408 (-) Transcript_118296:36-1259(-)
MATGRTLTINDELPLPANRYAVAISWDHGGVPVDVDLQAVVVDNRGCIIDAVYYNNMKALRCMTHSGDEQTGEKSGLDEVIWLTLAKMPENVQMVIFVVAAHSGGHLRDVRNGFIHVLEERLGNEVARFRMEESIEEVDVVAAMVRSHGAGTNAAPWSLLVIDEPAQDGQHFMDVLEPSIGNLVRRFIPGAPKRQKVAFAMEKAAVLDLPATTDFRCITAGLGWDVAGRGVDLDVSAVLFNGSCKVEGIVFFGNLQGFGLTHSGDNLTGEGEGDDEQIRCHLNQIPATVQQIFFIVNIYTRHCSFKQVKNAYCRILDDAQNELARYQLQEGLDKTGLVIARLFRESGERWGFQALGRFAMGKRARDCVPEMAAIFRKSPREVQLRGGTGSFGSVQPMAAQGVRCTMQ